MKTGVLHIPRQAASMLFAVGAALLIAAPVAAAAGAAGHRHVPFGSVERYISVLEEEGRAAWQKPRRVIDVLPLDEGDRAADIGAGSGYFTVLLAEKVGPRGTVFAVDIEQEMLDYIERRLRAEGIGNVVTVLAGDDDPRLPEEAVDLVFICDTYHHLPDRVEYMRRLKKVLRPGGRVAIVDFRAEKTPVGPPLSMRLSRSQVIEEMEAADFSLEGEFYFLPYQYFLVFMLGGVFL
ncbi:MAG TPA: class I SAM-dependent methyltransferase [Deltaproteobacteria bacterium]|nr:class I SAM-dependent methyltransferase [Deltaproteobacteria bacterium]